MPSCIELWGGQPDGDCTLVDDGALVEGNSASFSRWLILKRRSTLFE